MLKTVQLPILTGSKCYIDYNLGNGYTVWMNSSQLEAARSSGVFFASKLNFDTSGLKLRGKVNLFLELTAIGTSNPYGTSLILTTTELTSEQVLPLTTEEELKAIDGFVAYTNCTSHTTSGNISAGEKFSYALNEVEIRKNTPYYIYIKRQIGWENTGSLLYINGYTQFYNPAYPEYP